MPHLWQFSSPAGHWVMLCITPPQKKHLLSYLCVAARDDRGRVIKISYFLTFVTLGRSHHSCCLGDRSHIRFRVLPFQVYGISLVESYLKIQLLVLKEALANQGRSKSINEGVLYYLFSIFLCLTALMLQYLLSL